MNVNVAREYFSNPNRVDFFTRIRIYFEQPTDLNRYKTHTTLCFIRTEKGGGVPHTITGAICRSGMIQQNWKLF